MVSSPGLAVTAQNVSFQNDGTVRTHSAARAVITGRNTDCSILFGDNKREGKGFRGYENTLIPSVSSVYDKM